MPLPFREAVFSYVLVYTVEPAMAGFDGCGVGEMQRSGQCSLFDKIGFCFN